MVQNQVIQLFLALGLIVIAAKAAGYASLRLGQPAVLGELLIGIILGASGLNLLHWPSFTDPNLDEAIRQFAELGVLLLLFNAGLEMHLDELRRIGRIALYSGMIGQLLSIALVIPVTLVAQYTSGTAFFVAMMLAPTSVSISAQAIRELGHLRSNEGIALLGAAIIDDVTAIILVSVLLAVSVTGDGLGSVVHVMFRLVLFLVVATGIGWIVLPRLADRVADLPISSGPLAFAVCSALLFGWSAEAFGGMAAITGAFIAGVCLSRTRSDVRRVIGEGLHSLSYGLLVPIFFVDIGLRTDLHQLTWGILPFAAGLLAVAIAAKIVGCGLGARLGGFDSRSALRVGAGMVSRGEVGLIIGAIALQYRLIPGDVFPAIVLVILGTALVTPPLERRAFREPSHTPPEVAVAYGED